MKRTIAIQNPCELRIERGQLLVKRDGQVAGRIPMEDIGVLLLEDRQIMLSRSVLSEAVQHNAAVIVCDNTFHPNGLLLSLDANNLQRKLFEAQLTASEPLKKNLWRLVVTCKLQNQAKALEHQGKSSAYLIELSKKVKSGDGDQCEAQGAAYYWRNIFDQPLRRERNAPPPNAFLNYGYAVLRAMTARAIMCAGLLPTWGIHHRNQYNAYCLADDLMEPFRPWVDLKVAEIIQTTEVEELTTDIKKLFWSMATWDTSTEDGLRPMEHALTAAAASLKRSFTEKKANLELAYVVA